MHWRICTFERRVSSFHQLDVKAQRAIQNCLFAIHSIRGTWDVQNLHEQTSERWIVIVQIILCSSYTTLPRTSLRCNLRSTSHTKNIFATQHSQHTRRTIFATRADVKKNLPVFQRHRKIAEALNMIHGMLWHAGRKNFNIHVLPPKTRYWSVPMMAQCGFTIQAQTDCHFFLEGHIKSIMA